MTITICDASFIVLYNIVYNWRLREGLMVGAFVRASVLGVIMVYPC
jgi:hypothetical protein